MTETGTVIFALGVLFLLYFFIRTAIVKPARLKFSVFWLYAGIISILVSVLLFFTQNVFLFLLCLFEIGLCLIAAAGMIYIDAFARSEHKKTYIDVPEYIIIAGVHYPSYEFNARVDAALYFWQNNKETEIICTGGKVTTEPAAQAEAMYEVLRKAGVPAKKIHIESKSLSTADNLRYSAEIIGDKNKRIAIVTSDYHVLRAEIIARKVGYSGVAAIPVSFKGVSWPNYALRELYLIVRTLIKI